jgi:uncharacterized protein (TIGR02246 family)
MTDKKVSPLTLLKRRLQNLEDKEAIREMLSRYALAIDLKRVEDFLDLWTPDGVLVSDGSGSIISIKGREEIRAYLAPFLTIATQHLLLDYLIEVNGDTATAVGYQVMTDTREDRARIGRCAVRSFRFRRVKGKWRIEEAISRGIANTAECEKLIPAGWLPG